MKRIGLVGFIWVFVCSVLLAGEIPGVGVSERHLCLLQKNGVHCFDESGEVAVPFLKNFEYPFDVHGGGNTTCVRDYHGVHCWNWDDLTLKDYPRLKGMTDFQISQAFICAQKDKHFYCSLAPKSPMQELPLLPGEEIVNNEKHETFPVVLDQWICLVQVEKGKSQVNCYHPARPVGDALQFKWDLPVRDTATHGNTLALLWANHDRETGGLGVWELPSDPLSSNVAFKETTWKQADYSSGMALSLFSPPSHYDLRKIIFPIGSDWFVFGNREYIVERQYQKIETSRRLVEEDGRKPRWESTYEERPNHITAYRLTGGIPSFEVQNTKRTRTEYVKGTLEKVFGRMVKFDDEMIPLQMNDNFVCKIIPKKTGGSVSCGTPGTKVDYFDITPRFQISELPVWNIAGGIYQPYANNWEKMHEYIEKLPQAKAAFVKALIYNTFDGKSMRLQAVYRDLIQPILESSESSFFEDVSWRTGLSLGELHYSLSEESFLGTDVQEIVARAEKALAEVSQDKDTNWQTRVKERIERYKK